MNYRALLLLVFLVVPSSAFCAGTILIVGDSLSAAYGMPVNQGWVTLLQEQLSKEKLTYDVVNASISGETTAGARARLPQMLERYQADVVLLQLGGNDGLRGLSLDKMERNIAAMIEAAIGSDAELLLVGVQLPPNYGQRYTDRFQATYRDLAKKYRVPLIPSIVDGVGGRSEFMQPDGIHPNASAQPIMFAHVWPWLKPLLVDQSL